MNEHEAPAVPVDRTRIVTLAREALAIEAAAVSGLQAKIDDGFVRAVELVLACQGRVVVMGMGKSGHIGRKISATLASTGTPAMFVHPAEASHGDLGMVTRRDVVLAISNSGESDELLNILPLIRRIGVPLLAMSGRVESSLARHADVVLDSGVALEACPLNLAPTASTTAQLALGDALAVALLDARGFGKEDFARSHPGGALGRRLLVHVQDLLAPTERAPQALPDTPLTELLHTMSRAGMGIAAIVDTRRQVVGVFTDGDLRRLIEAGRDLRGLTARDVMGHEPRTIRAEALAVEAAELMETHKVTSVLVVDGEGCFVGALNTNALLRAKVI
jgi:arabinose-5-phosphate isomerase